MFLFCELPAADACKATETYCELPESIVSLVCFILGDVMFLTFRRLVLW